ncbi:MarR family transcriptional regulator [Desulfosporosinus sp. FKA]|uniref:MarR family winged helix-turn-helix transcriptional regulator n=1 Tax=Desulfosporosinus sp. FKA TaxID=1969834 RepID=UPI000B499E6D|nr:MarR family transcriptional regulator [Desulfosporosinus sp. FKA]
MNTNDVVSLISKIREKANRFIVSEMTKYGVEGIVTSHGDIINALFKNSRLTMAEIAGKIGRDKSTVTTLVDKLVRFGYVTKERDTVDTRVVYVTLTSKGSELKSIFNAISREVLNALYFDISESEKEELVRILNKIYRNL